MELSCKLHSHRRHTFVVALVDIVADLARKLHDLLTGSHGCSKLACDCHLAWQLDEC